MEGTVKFFNETKGFGFVVDDADGTEYFTHISGVLNNAQLNEGDKVSFEVEEGRKGLNAVNVETV
jgi:CspA family cold shock protein